MTTANIWGIGITWHPALWSTAPAKIQKYPYKTKHQFLTIQQGHRQSINQLAQQQQEQNKWMAPATGQKHSPWLLQPDSSLTTSKSWTHPIPQTDSSSPIMTAEHTAVEAIQDMFDMFSSAVELSHEPQKPTHGPLWKTFMQQKHYYKQYDNTTPTLSITHCMVIHLEKRVPHRRPFLAIRVKRRR